MTDNFKAIYRIISSLEEQMDSMMSIKNQV
jgi:hypothetical protein